MPEFATSADLLDYLVCEGRLYRESLQAFLISNKLEVYGTDPLDHIAIKAKDTVQYESLIELLLPVSLQGSFVSMDNRRIATVDLEKPLRIGTSDVQCIEIMEPRPEKVGRDYVGFEHAEIYSSHIAKIEEYAKEKGISYEAYTNDSHHAIVFQINDKNQEIKFTDATHIDVLRIEKEHGKLQLLKSR